MERPVFGKKSSRLQRPRVDRFIVPRESLTNERRRWSSRFDYEKTVNIWEAKHQQHRNYRKYLDEVFGLEPLKRSPPKGDDEAYLQPWPCAPRRKGFLSSAESILDLPTYSYSTFPELLDWSNANMLVAALGINYHMYSWKNQSVQGQGITKYPIHCCKFDPKGDVLLIGTMQRTVELHDSQLHKMVQRATCKCIFIMGLGVFIAPCAITAADWSPTGNSFVTGCSRGFLVCFDRRTAKMNKCRRLTRNSISSVKISPDTRFVAAVDLNSSYVRLLVWPSLDYYFSLSVNQFIKSISWHPWRSALLGVGVMTPRAETAIALWEAPSSKLREATLGCYNNYTLDVMMFSHRTGELVLSLWNAELADSYTRACSQLVVLSDPYTVVDQSGDGKIGLDRVRTMVFSPDGSKLATATADEDLVIWNFLPEDKKKNYNKSRRFSAIPVYLDLLTDGFVVR